MDRFWSKVDRRGVDDCWHWKPGSQNHNSGYGSFWIEGHTRSPHRVAYYLTHGYWPTGQVGHLCHDRDISCTEQPCAHRLCCNPAHLAEQTPKENLTSARRQERQRFCRRGHDLTVAENVYLTKQGRRQCRVCRRERLASQRIDCGHALETDTIGRQFCPLCRTESARAREAAKRL